MEKIIPFRILKFRWNKHIFIKWFVMVPYYLMNWFIYVSKRGVAFHSYISSNKKRGGEKAGQWEIDMLK